MALEYKPTDLMAKTDVTKTIMSEGASAFNNTLKHVGEGFGNAFAAVIALATGGAVAVGVSKKDDAKSPATEATHQTVSAEIPADKKVGINDLSQDSLDQIERVAETKAFRDAVVALGGVGSAAISASTLEIAVREDGAPVLSVAAPERDKTGPTIPPSK